MANNSGGKPLLIACGGCALLFVGLLVLSVGGGIALTQGPVNAVKAHVALVKAGKLDEAYTKMSAGFRGSISQAQFEAFVAKQATLYQGDDLTLNDRQVKNGEARIAGTTTKGKTSLEVRFLLTREDGAWKISTIETGASTRPVLDAAKAHVDLVREGKVDQAWEATSEKFQQVLSEAAFRDFAARTGALYRSQALSFPASRFLDEARTAAEVEGKATGPDKKPYAVRMQLRLENDTWKVSLVEVKPAGAAKTEAAKTEAAKTEATKTEAVKTGE